jgi:predicted phage baseplate assembly protein
MTVPAPRLDDLTWAQMMEAIRERIPAASEGRWTLHAPVDPGMNLLELYAWLLEQRLYLLDRVPDGLARGVLGLLGVPAPRSAVPAATVLALRPLPGQAHPRTEVAAGTELHRSLGGRRVVFTTEQTVALVPAGPWRLLVDGVDRTADLHAFGDGVDLQPAATADGPAGGPANQRPPPPPQPVELVLTVPEAFDPAPGAWLALLLELETGARVPPAWSPLAPAGVPPPAQVTWSYEAAPGRFEPFQAPTELEDGTGGLRRAGIVRLAWPAAWRPGPGPAPPGTVERRLRFAADRAGFSSPPRLRSLAVNAAVARHRRRVRPRDDALERLDAQLERWRSLPGQELHLEGAAGQLLDNPASVRLRLTERDGAEHLWEATGDLGSHGPADRVFVVDRGKGRLRFGDGRTGRLPVVTRRADGPPRLRLRYQLGGGEEANLGVVSWVSDALPVEATSAVPARFGQEPETIEQARRRAADELGRPTRAVLPDDYRQLAMATPGVDVARAHVAVGRHPATPCDPVAGAVTVVIVPGVPRNRLGGGPEVAAPIPDPGALAAVRANLERARLVGTELFVDAPRYRQVRLAVTPGAAVADPVGLHRRLLEGLGRYLDPLTGGPDGDGWPFGEPLRPSELLGVAQELAGRAAVLDAVAVGIDGAAPSEACLDVAIAAHELVVLRDLTLAAPPAGSGNGGLA